MKDRTSIHISKETREKLFSMKDYDKRTMDRVISDLVSFYAKNNKGTKKNDWRKKK
jgi:hypothetical protein